jgi:hypothetical protein
MARPTLQLRNTSIINYDHVCYRTLSSEVYYGQHDPRLLLKTQFLHEISCINLPNIVHLFTHILQFKISVVWDVMPSSLVDAYQCFRGTPETICRTEAVPPKQLYLSTKLGIYNTEEILGHIPDKGKLLLIVTHRMI